jgi:Cu/Ag efflux pump CusA
VKSLEDIGEIVVKNINGIPVYIKNVADVRFGSIIALVQLLEMEKAKNCWVK